MQHGDLVDIIPENRKYTWSNRRLGSNNIMERLDWFLVNISFLSSYSVVNVSILPFVVSDHYPIILAIDSHYTLGPLPFKYNHIWSDYPEAKCLIQQTWCHHIEGSPGFIWESKLKNVKKTLKIWAKMQYNESEKEKKSIKREEEEKWRIKSKQTWLKSGDKNTSYFHRQATVWKIKNNITAIIDNAGNQHSDQTAIKNVASAHFKELLTEIGEEELYVDLLQHLPTKITADFNKRLTEEIKEEEIKEAIWCL
eukprot:PITA_30632